MNKRTRLFFIALAVCMAIPFYACDDATAHPQPPDGPTINTPSQEENNGSTDNGSNGDNSNNGSNGNTSNGGTENNNGNTGNSTGNSGNSNNTAPAPTPQAQTATYIRCVGDNVNLRSGAGTDYAILGQSEKGTMYAVIGKTGNWYKVNYRNKTAYLYSEYASVFTLKKSTNPAIEKVLEEGYKLLGVPYVYGAVRLHDGKGNFLKGFTVNKFDCSSLVQYAFYKGANKLLDVTTRTQVVQGKYVKPSDLKRGDCIYFTNESRQHKTGVERVGHVAIYLGDNYILHTASDYARIEKMTTSRWNFYVETRRFL